MQGSRERLDWAGREHLCPLFNDFVLATVVPNAFSAEDIQERGERWREAMTIMAYVYQPLRAHLSRTPL